MSNVSQVGVPADSGIVTVPPLALIVDPTASDGKKTSGAKSKKTAVAKGKKELSLEEEQALIIKAKAALAALDAHGDDYLPKMLAFGDAAHQAKASKPHGEFKKWCQQHLHRSSSWVSTYRRLFEERAHLQDALAWARETEHKWAYCRSVERLLKVIAECKAKDSAANDNEATPKKAKEVIAELEQRLKKAEAELVVLRDLIRTQAIAAATGDATAKEALAAFTQACHSRLRDLVAIADQTASGLEVSEPAPAPNEPHPDIEEQDKLDTSVAGDLGGGGNDPRSGTAITPSRPAVMTLPPASDGLLTLGGTPMKMLLSRKAHG